MSSTVSVRSATTDDVPAIQRVARASWRRAYEDVFDDEQIRTMVQQGYDDDVLAEMVELDDVGLFVATVDDEVVGYASCGRLPATASSGPAQTDATHEMAESGGIGDLDIYVHPVHWGEGIGEALLERGREHLAALEATRIRDEVLAANEVGNAFYRKHFERVDQRTVEFGGRELPVNVYETGVPE